MSEENTGQAPENTPEASTSSVSELENKVGSFDEKLAAIQAQIEAQNSAMANQMNQMVDAVTRSAPPAAQDELDPYSPDYAQRLKEDLRRELQAEQTRARQEDFEKQQAITRLNAEYPELSQSGSALSKKVLEAHSKLPKNLQDTASGYQLAVREAAAALALMPKAARASHEENFSLDAGKGGESSKSNKGATGDELDASTEAFASLVGLDVNNKEVRQRLIDNAKRTYGKWR